MQKKTDIGVSLSRPFPEQDSGTIDAPTQQKWPLEKKSLARRDQFALNLLLLDFLFEFLFDQGWHEAVYRSS